MTSEKMGIGQVWSVYLVKCSDGSLYTGIAKDVPTRVGMHNKGAGAKYTRGRGPVELVYCEMVGTRAAAQRREYAIKQLPKAQKFQMVAAFREEKAKLCRKKC